MPHFHRASGFCDAKWDCGPKIGAIKGLWHFLPLRLRMRRTFTGRQAFTQQNNFERRWRTSRNAAHLQGRLHAFTDYSMLEGKDDTLAMTVHCEKNGTLFGLQRGHQNAVHTIGSSGACYAAFSKCGCGAFVAFFLTCTVEMRLPKRTKTRGVDMMCIKRMQQMYRTRTL